MKSSKILENLPSEVRWPPQNYSVIPVSFYILKVQVYSLKCSKPQKNLHLTYIFPWTAIEHLMELLHTCTAKPPKRPPNNSNSHPFTSLLFLFSFLLFLNDFFQIIEKIKPLPALLFDFAAMPAKYFGQRMHQSTSGNAARPYSWLIDENVGLQACYGAVRATR